MILSGNKVLITGGNKGIGLALAKKFLKLNNQVIITGRNVEDLQAVKQCFPEIHIINCDLATREGLEKLTQYIKKEHQDLNVLINNAGIQYNHTFAEDPEAIKKIEFETQINFLAPVKLTALLLPILEQNNNAAIVNVSSVLALVPKVVAPIYCANKAGLHIFTKTLRQQLKKAKVFEILPPLVDTAMTKGRGKNKITAEKLVDKFMFAFEKNRYEVRIGKVKLLLILNRISAGLASRIINKD